MSGFDLETIFGFDLLNWVGGLSILFLILMLAYCLIFAPLYIWKWTKATKKEITRLNNNLAVAINCLQNIEKAIDKNAAACPPIVIVEDDETGNND